MKTHHDIDQRSLALARAIVVRIDADPQRKGLKSAQATCARWLTLNPEPAAQEWQTLLTEDWSVIRNVLLDEGEDGRRLRQNSPFCGVLSPHERWAIYRQYRHEPQAA